MLEYLAHVGNAVSMCGYPDADSLPAHLRGLVSVRSGLHAVDNAHLNS